MEIVFFIIALLVMITGLIGVIVPVLPGVPLIFSATLVYAIITGFAEITVNLVIIFGSLAALTFALDWLSASFGVKKMGGSYLGVIGAFLGMAAGLFIAGLFGLIAGSFFGAFLAELLAGKSRRDAWRAGAGSFIGFLVGGAVKFAIGAAMIGVFVWKVLF